MRKGTAGRLIDRKNDVIDREKGVTWRMAGMEKWKKWFSRDNLLIWILSGVLLFIITMPTEKEKEETAGSGENMRLQEQERVPSKQEVPQTEKVDFAAKLEAELEEILSAMWGVGKVRVMITLQSSEELVLEKDEAATRANTNESDSVGGSRIVTQMETEENTVYHTSGDGSEPYVIKTISPKVEGVVVVAQGADSGTVNRNITEMVQALFGVEAHKVKVVKMTEQE